MKTQILIAGILLLGSLGSVQANDDSLATMKDVTAEQIGQVELAQVEGKGGFCFTCYKTTGSSSKGNIVDGNQYIQMILQFQLQTQQQKIFGSVH